MSDVAREATRVFAMLLVLGGATRPPAECRCFAGVIMSEADRAGLGAALFVFGVADGGCGKEPMLTTFLTAFSLLGVVGLVPFGVMPLVIGVWAVGMPDEVVCFLVAALGVVFWRVGRDDVDTVRAVEGVGTSDAPEPLRECGDMDDDSDCFLALGMGSEGSGPDGGAKDGRAGRGSVEVVAMAGG